MCMSRVECRHVSHPLSVRSLRLTWLIFSRANNTRLNPSLFPLACDKREKTLVTWSMECDPHVLVAQDSWEAGAFIQTQSNGLCWQDKGRRDGKWWWGKKKRSTSQEPLTWHMPLFKWQRAMYGRMWLLRWMLEDTLPLDNVLCSPPCEQSWAM